MTNDKTVTMSRELAERIVNLCWFGDGAAESEEELRAILAAPAVDRQPDFWSWLASAYRDGSEGEQPKFTKYNMEVAYQAGAKSSPPAPVAVVLPERETYCRYLRGVIPENRFEVEAYKDGWNACLDKVKEMNQ